MTALAPEVLAPICPIPGAVNPGDAGVVVGHRGASAAYPENTMPAFHASYAGGADYFETDFDWTMDNVIFAMHDGSVDRTTDGTGNNHALTWDYIKGLDAGSWKGAQFAGVKVPSAEDIFGWMQQTQETGKPAKLLLELKGSWPIDKLQLLDSLIQQYDVAEQIIIQDFDAGTIGRWHQVNPEIPGMVLVGSLPADPVAFAHQYHAIGVNPSSTPSPRVLDAMHRAGLKVFVWAVNSSVAWANLTKLGVDGIITDLPAELEAWQADYIATKVPQPLPEECFAPAPVATVGPAVTGTDEVGGLLSATPGEWDTEGLAFAYQWYADGQPIAGATGPTYQLTAASNGASVTVTVTATKKDTHDGTATSEPFQATTLPMWDASNVYQKGDRVLYDGSVYVAAWYTRGETPGASREPIWQEVGVEVATAGGVVRAWTPTWIYRGG